MSQTQLLERHIFNTLCRALDQLSNSVVIEIYALSFWVYSDEDDPRHPVLEFSYNTTTQFERATPNASSAAEAKWNFAYWLQDCVVRIGGKDDHLIAAWLHEKNLNYTNDEALNESDRCMDLDIIIEEEFWNLCARIAKQLHDDSEIAKKFGHPIPIIIHNLEYHEKNVELARGINPPGTSDEFVDWASFGN